LVDLFECMMMHGLTNPKFKNVTPTFQSDLRGGQIYVPLEAHRCLSPVGHACSPSRMCQESTCSRYISSNQGFFLWYACTHKV